MAIFDPHRIDTPRSTDHQKICHRWLSRRPLRLCQIRCIYVHGGLLGTWVKYNQNYFYLYPFLGTHLQVRRVDGFSRMMAQTTRTRARMCLLWEFFTLLPFRGSKTPNFGAWIGVVKPNSRNRKTCILSKLQHRFQPNFDSDQDRQMPFVSGPHTRITNPRWRTAAILEKPKNCYISAVVWAISTKFGTVTQFVLRHRRTDGSTIAYSEREREFTSAKNWTDSCFGDKIWQYPKWSPLRHIHSAGSLLQAEIDQQSTRGCQSQICVVGNLRQATETGWG